MKIYYDLENIRISQSIITVGTFDGVHLGHQYLIETLVKRAKEQNLESVVFTFDPYPQEVFGTGPTEETLLSTISEKVEVMRKLGVDHLVVYPFSKAFASLTSSEFISDFLVSKLSLKYLLLGYDHKFGRDKESSVSHLQKLGDRLGFEVSRLDQKRVADVDLSSSIIRKELQEGNVKMVRELLGRTYSVSGKVVRGKQIGRTIAFPTANLQVNDSRKMLPKKGVYAVVVCVDGHNYKGMLNIGVRPTIEDNRTVKTIETHIFDFDMDIYHKELSLFFVERIRDEKKFDSLKSLTTQLERDAQQCHDLFHKINLNIFN